MIVRFGAAEIDCGAIAFDKDGTLFDRLALWQGQYAARAEVLRRHLEPALVSDYAVAIGVDSASGAVDPDGPLAMGSGEQERLALASWLYRTRKFPWDDCLERATDWLDQADAITDPDSFCQPLPGVPAVPLELAAARLPLALVTMDKRHRAEIALQRMRMQAAFGTVVTPADVRRPKPAPDMLLLAAEQLGASVESMVVVGDTRSDVEMARAAGATPVLLDPESPDPEPEPDLIVISSLRQIRLGPGKK